MKLPLQGKIHLRSSETSQHIAPEIARLPGGRWRKSCWIKSLAARILRSIEYERHPRHRVRTRIQCDAVRKDNSADHVNGRSRSGEDEAVHRPAAEGRVKNLVRFRRGQVVGDASREGMPDVKVGVPAVYIRIRDRAWRVEVVGKG